MSFAITIAGGGSTYTPGIIKTLINSRKDFTFDEIRLYDIDEDKLKLMEVIIKQLVKQNCTDVKVVATLDPKLAFTGTKYIFSQIRVGGLKMREQDEKIPLAHGLVGQETCGLGGFSYGLRSIKGFLEMVGYIQEYSPEAWILNYTNPESIISEAVRRQYPNVKIINACDMTVGLEEVLSENFGYDRSDWLPVYYGLNHFGWYSEIYDMRLKRDVMPEIIDKVKEYGLTLKDGDESWKETYEMMGNIIKQFPDSIPNNYLEYYLYPDLKVKSANPNYTRANEVMDNREQNVKKLAQHVTDGGNVEVDDGVHGKYIVDIARSIENDLNLRFNLLVPNKGSIPNLRQDAVVEVPCYVSSKGLEPISLRKDIPDFHKGLMEAQVAAEKLLVDAFFENSYNKALQAFTLNQTVPNANVAKQVLDEFIEINGDYWPELL